ncbi:BlaI/MecI/CopY family transcriptional regulator [Thermaerobacter sp. PB12/4term]|uniref:BlaI/MecI/CopY family transcriptional regulator n=1 Tax=Thermaerobacter sp. PB12/4term TaxID=2293838 RepID=UPI000E32C076|nr:BlaI/MecI/CopY family transcriptional regulator [Thermaerobacter sp. PB12/4term]QIA27450.1 BlaI/MecI/CopY family transcriptional regulator [Thermaerobacter sp. PB12/4term]
MHEGDHPIRIFRLGDQGLRRVLGELEATVMEVVWAGPGAVTIREVTERLSSSRQPLAFNTVMTVMNRLVAKGLLRRSGRKGSYTYRPAMDREAFLREVTRRVAAGLVQDFGSLAVSQFVDVLAEEAPDALAELERELRRRQVHDEAP